MEINYPEDQSAENTDTGDEFNIYDLSGDLLREIQHPFHRHSLTLRQPLYADFFGVPNSSGL